MTTFRRPGAVIAYRHVWKGPIFGAWGSWQPDSSWDVPTLAG